MKSSVPYTLRATATNRSPVYATSPKEFLAVKFVYVWDATTGPVSAYPGTTAVVLPGVVASATSAGGRGEADASVLPATSATPATASARKNRTRESFMIRTSSTNRSDAKRAEAARRRRAGREA